MTTKKPKRRHGISVRFTQEQRKYLDTRAEREGVSVSTVARWAVQGALEVFGRDGRRP